MQTAIDADLVRQLATTFTDRLIYTTALGWLEYPDDDPTHWREVPIERVLKLVSDEYRALYLIGVAEATDPKEAAKSLSSLLSVGKARSILDLFAGFMLRSAEDFDSQPYLLNTPSGVVDLRTSALLDHDPKLMLTLITAVPFVPSARSDVWERILRAVPAEVLPWFQQSLGSGLIGEVGTEVLMCVGGGSNGKTALTNTATSALGDYSVLVSDKMLTASAGEHNTSMTALKGRRVALLEELPEGKLNMATVKKITDTPKITARRMRKDDMTWDASHTLVMTSNHKPVINDTDHGAWRRWALVLFPYTFKRDDKIKAALQTAEVKEAALAWLIEGAVQRVSNPLPTPAKIARDTNEWRAETDWVVSYITARTEFDPDSRVLSSDLIEDLNRWRMKTGASSMQDREATPALEAHEFLSVNGVSKERTRNLDGLDRPAFKNGHPVPKDKARVFVGLRFRDDSDERLHDEVSAWTENTPAPTTVGLDWADLLRKAATD